MIETHDIILLNLHRRYVNQPLRYGGFSGLYLIAAFLEQNGYDGRVYVGDFQKGLDFLEGKCKKKAPKVIGLYCDFDNITENIAISRYVKRHYNIPVIVGGPQATALKEDFFQQSNCDAIVRYEGELTVLELMNYFIDGVGNLAEIKGIMFRNNGQLIVQPEQDLIENLDLLPFVDEKYSLNPEFRKTQACVMTGRGCPFHCAFCHEGHHTKKVRFRSVDNVLEEVKLFLKNNSGQDDLYVLFTDDTFTLKPARVKAICEGLKKLQEYRPFTWFCEGHIHTIYQNPEMLSDMARAGARRVQLGIEAGTQPVLDAYRKGSTVEEIKAVITACRDHGIAQIYSNIILGGAFFTREVFEADVEFAKELLLLGAGVVEIGVVSFWPLAETSMTKKPQEYGIHIVDDEFMTSIGDFPQTETAELSIWEINNMVRDMKKILYDYMKDMLSNGLVSEERILSWFKDHGGPDADGLWWYVLKENHLLFSYYELLASKEAVQSRGIRREVLMEYHPMRVFQMWQACETNENGVSIICDVEVSGLERQLLRYSLGKLTLKQVLEKVYKAIGKTIMEETAFIEEAIRIMTEFEKRHWIVYSKF